jgi:pimeloyl-ACP methyl ester carboxylesterase
MLDVDRLSTDVVELGEHLAARFQQPCITTGFSQGGTLALLRPDLFATVVAVGPDIDGPAAERAAYDYALSTARERGNKRALKELNNIDPPPHLSARQFGTRVRWVSNSAVRLGATYRSIATTFVADILRSPDYSAADVVRIFRQIPRTREAMLPELVRLNLIGDLPKIDTPVVVVQGRHDQVAPPEAAARFLTTLTAPTMRLAWFDHSAHMPHYEEPGPFRSLLAEVRSTCHHHPASG